jgi:phenylacetate-CoA ligase
MYHVFTQDCVVEFVDAHDRPAAADEAASLLLTRLHPGPMPLIRYRVGDMGIKGLLKTCSCGRGFETMQSVTGRESDIVYTTTGNRLYVHFFTGILEHFDEIESFQVHQRSREGFVVSIVPTDRYTPEADERIRRRLWERGAQGMRIQIEIVDTIPLTSAGKRKFIISDVREA